MRIAPARRRRIGNRDGWIGQICDRPIDPQLPYLPGTISAEAYMSVEHLVPLRLGGTDHDTNLVIAHRACNHMADLLSGEALARSVAALNERWYKLRGTESWTKHYHYRRSPAPAASRKT